MAELQKEKIELAKEISELEMNTNWASGGLSKLRAELATLEARNVAQEVNLTPEMFVSPLLCPSVICANAD
jgi:predicted nuclease with TOPRIM domain